MPVKRVFISSPRDGDPERDTARAQRYLLEAIQRNVAPFAPHLLYPQVLDEDTERAEGLLCGLAYLQVCDELWVYGDPTNGMHSEIAMARDLGIPIVRHPLEREEFAPRMN
jgi:hypothetical protein